MPEGGGPSGYSSPPGSLDTSRLPWIRLELNISAKGVSVHRIVLVTGGGNGLGRAVAARFLADGDAVFITGRNAGRVAGTAAEIGAKPIAGDATNPAQVARMAGGIGDDLDVLVNMAGGNTDFTTPAGGPGGPGGPVAELERVAAAWHANGLTANVISPGYIAETDFFRGRLTEERKATLIKATHDGRAGQPGDIAETAYFLASEGARHLTGQALHVNGGAHTTR